MADLFHVEGAFFSHKAVFVHFGVRGIGFCRKIACRVIARYGGDVHEFARRVQWDPEEHKRISAEESANYKDWWL